MTATILSHSYLIKSDMPYANANVGLGYKNLAETCSSLSFETAIRDLCGLLAAQHHRTVWILVDDYDAAVNQAFIELDSDSAHEIAELFGTIYLFLFKGNPYLDRGLITGLQYHVRSGVLSGLSNLVKFNIRNSRYSRHYGVNNEELDVLFDYYSVKETERSQVKVWYNGYKENIGSAENKKIVDKYNIWPVVNYLTKGENGFVSFWKKRGSISFMAPLLKRKQFQERIEALVSGESIVIKKLTEDFTVSDFLSLKSIIAIDSIAEISQDGFNLIFSYLFFAGYLTLTEDYSEEYRLPNREMREEFGDYLMKYYKLVLRIDNDNCSDIASILNKVFVTDSIEEILAIITTEFAPAFYDFINSFDLNSIANERNGMFADEDLMHMFINFIALQVHNSLFATERATTKLIGKGGRADCVVIKNFVGIVFEIKYDDDESEKALVQCKDYANLVADCTTNVFLSCNISKEKRVTISGEIIQNNLSAKFKF